MIEGQRDKRGEELVRDLLEVVKDEGDALLHRVEEGSSDVLKLAKSFLTDIVAQQTVEFDCFIEPKFDRLSLVGRWQVVKSHQMGLS